jgi:hypothetical protein
MRLEQAPAPPPFPTEGMGQRAPAPDAGIPASTPPAAARQSFIDTLQREGLFDSFTTAAAGAADKSLYRNDRGQWNPPIMARTSAEPTLYERFTQGAAGLIQKTGARLDEAGPGVDKDAIRGVFDRYQQENNLSDEQMKAVWQDANNVFRPWDDGERVRTLSDGRLVPNPQDSTWLDPQKAGELIDKLDATDEAKARLRAQLPRISDALATAKLEGYEAAASAVNLASAAGSLGTLGLTRLATGRMEPPSEWAERTGRTGEGFGSPEFIRAYEQEVIEPVGGPRKFIRGLVGKGLTGWNKLATTVLGVVGSDAAASGSEAGRVISSGLPDTGLAGAVVEEAPSVLAQVVTGRTLGAAAAIAGPAAPAITRLGVFTAAGAQSYGMTYAVERDHGATKAEAKEKARKAGLTTAIVTGMFGSGAIGGLERAAVGQAETVTLRTLFGIAREQGVKNLARSPQAREFMRDVILASGGEATEEAIDQFAQSFLTADPDTDLSGAWDEAIQAGKIGGIIGGAANVAVSAATDPALDTAADLALDAQVTAPDVAKAAADEVAAARRVATAGTTETLTDTGTPEGDVLGDFGVERAPAEPSPQPPPAPSPADAEAGTTAESPATLEGGQQPGAPPTRDVGDPAQMNPAEWAERQASAEGNEGLDLPFAPTHRTIVKRAVEDLAAVSTEAVDTYGIDLPPGYVREGDLYVYRPEQSPTPAPPDVAPPSQPGQGEVPQQGGAAGVAPVLPPHETGAGAGVGRFAPDDVLTMRSAFTNEDTEVSYRGPDPQDETKSVVWTGRTQMSVPTMWLRRPGTEPAEPAPAETIPHTASAPAEALPLPTTKKGLIDELAGPIPRDYQSRVRREKTVKALSKFKLAELRERVVDARARDAEYARLSDITLANNYALNPEVDAAGRSWAAKLKEIGARYGIDFTLAPGGKGDSIYKLSRWLAEKGVDLRTPTTPPTNEDEAQRQGQGQGQGLQVAPATEPAAAAPDEGAAAEPIFTRDEIEVGQVRSRTKRREAGTDGERWAEVQAPGKVLTPENWSRVDDSKLSAFVSAHYDFASRKAPKKTDRSWVVRAGTHAVPKEVLARGLTFAEAVERAKDHVESANPQPNEATTQDQVPQAGSPATLEGQPTQQAPAGEAQARAAQRGGEGAQGAEVAPPVQPEPPVSPAGENAAAGEQQVAESATFTPQSVEGAPEGEVPPQEPAAPEPEPLPGPPLPPAGEADPAPEGGVPDNLIAVKYAALDAELDRMGHPPLARPGSQAQQEAMDEAMRISDADPQAGPKLVDELLLRPRAWANVTEQFVAAIEIARRKIAVHKSLVAFNDNTDPGRKDALRSLKERDEMYLREALAAAGRAQTEWGRTGRASQTYINIEDFSLVSMRLRYQANVNDGKPLTDEQERKIADLYEKLRQKQAQIDMLTEAAEANDAERNELVRLVDRLSADVDQAQAKLARRNSTTLRKAKQALAPKLEDAKAYLASRRDAAPPDAADENGVERSFSGPSPEMVRQTAKDIEALSVVAADWLLDKSIKFGDFTHRMVSEFGEWVRSLVPRVWRKAKQLHYETVESVSGREARSAEVVVSEIDETAGVTKKDVWDLARAHVIGGLRGKAVLEAVHRDLIDAGIEITFDQVATLFTDYGKATYPSKAETEQELNRIRALERAGLKLRDVLAGRRPQRTGFQRGEVDAEVREAERQFREAYRESGLQDEDGRSLKTARGAAKRRMRNRIEDLRRAIDTRTKIENNRTPLEPDEEMLALRAELETAQAEYESVFGRGLTEEQRQANLVKTIDRQIAEEERLIAEGLASRPERTPVTETPEIAGRRARLKELRGQRKALATPGELNEARVQRYLKTIARSKQDLLRRIAQKDYEPRTRPEPPLDERIKEALRERDALRRQFNIDLLNAKLAQRSRAEKVFDNTIDITLRLPRAFMASVDVSGIGRQGWWTLLTHPFLAFKTIRRAGFKFTEESALKLEQEMENDPLYPAALKAKLALAKVGPGHTLAEMEEMYRSRLAGHVPIVKNSEIAYVTYLNALRFAHFKLKYAALQAREGGLTQENLAKVAGHINSLSGRGSFGKRGEKYVGGLSSLFFSPRFWWSRIQQLGGIPLSAVDAAFGFKLGREETKIARQIIAIERARLALGLIAQYSLITLAAKMLQGDDKEPPFWVGWDWRSSDFGKIKFRNGTRIDVGAGGLQNVVLAGKIITGEAVNTRTGQVVKLRGRGATPLRSLDNDFWRMLRSKASPTLGTAGNIIFGENVVGDPVEPVSEILGMYVPLPLSSSYESYKQLGFSRGTAAALLEMFGFASSTYGPGVQDASLRGDAVREVIAPAATAIFGVNPERYYEFYK